MKKLLKNNGEYMVRYPFFSYKEFELKKENIINDLCLNKEFREQLLISSKALYNQLDTYLYEREKMSEKKIRNFEESVYKYILRAIRRTTPFGLFSQVGVGKFADRENISIAYKYKKDVSVDIEWLIPFIKKLEREYYKKLEFIFNKACYIRGNRAYMLYGVDNDSKSVNVSASNAFMTLFNNIKSLTKYDEMIDILREKYADIDEKIFENYIKELIDKEILISNIRPPFTSDSKLIDYIVKKIKEYEIDEDMQKKLEKVIELINEYRFTKLGEGIDIYLEIEELLKSIYINDKGNYLQVDMITDDGIALEEDLGKKVNEIANMLVYMTKKDKDIYCHIKEYKEKFLEKYGEDREVSLLEMFDNTRGIGAPKSYKNPSNDFFEGDSQYIIENKEFSNYLRNEYLVAVSQDKDLVIDDDIINKYFKTDEIDVNEIPDSMELYFNVFRDNDGYKLYLEEMASDYAGRTFGRFAHSDERFDKMIKKFHDREREINKNIKMCEVNIEPHKSRNANVVHTKSYREYELSIFTMGRENIEQISLEDIVIGVKDENFYARHRNTGEIIKFSATNMYNMSMISNPIRFLMEISTMGKRKWTESPWNMAFKDYVYIPRIVYKDVVLNRKKWFVDCKYLEIREKDDFETFKEKWFDFQNKFNIPYIFNVVNADNKLFIDTRSERALKLLYSLLKKNKYKLELNEIEEGEGVLIDKNNNPHTCEIVVPLTKIEQNKSVNIEKKLECNNEERLKFPLDNWLYLKLYCNVDRETELLSIELENIINRLDLSNDSKYFFIRYKDPKRHIRLRINDSSEKLIQNMPILINEIKRIYDAQIISDISIDVYDRELERYGTEDVMGLMEELFAIDSKIVIQLLKMLENKETKLELEEIAIVSILHYLMSFGLDFNKQLEIMSMNFGGNEYRDEFKKVKTKYLDLFDMETEWVEFKKQEDREKIWSILNMRNTMVKQIISRYYELNISEGKIISMILSVIHMFCNRFIGIDRKYERKIMCYIEKILYAKKYKMKIKSK